MTLGDSLCTGQFFYGHSRPIILFPALKSTLLALFNTYYTCSFTCHLVAEWLAFHNATVSHRIVYTCSGLLFDL